MQLDHTAIAARDTQRLCDWYCDVLGFRVVARKQPSRADAADPTFLVEPPDGGPTLEVMPANAAERQERALFDPGVSHIALRVADFDACRDRLVKRGVRFSGPEVQAMGGGRLLTFPDPEGNMLQIVWRQS